MVKFTVEVEMKKRWVPHFLSMLSYMQYLGGVGGSRKVAIYADGDGDFRPKFRPSIEFERVKPSVDADGDRMYDAG